MQLCTLSSALTFLIFKVQSSEVVMWCEKAWAWPAAHCNTCYNYTECCFTDCCFTTAKRNKRWQHLDMQTNLFVIIELKLRLGVTYHTISVMVVVVWWLALSPNSLSVCSWVCSTYAYVWVLLFSPKAQNMWIWSPGHAKLPMDIEVTRTKVYPRASGAR